MKYGSYFYALNWCLLSEHSSSLLLRVMHITLRFTIKYNIKNDIILLWRKPTCFGLATCIILDVSVEAQFSSWFLAYISICLGKHLLKKFCSSWIFEIVTFLSYWTASSDFPGSANTSWNCHRKEVIMQNMINNNY